MDVKSEAQEILNLIARSSLDLEIEELKNQYEEESKYEKYTKAAVVTTMKIYKHIVNSYKSFDNVLTDFAFECINVNPSLHVTIAISG